jgi:hypothetical protein
MLYTVDFFSNLYFFDTDTETVVRTLSLSNPYERFASVDPTRNKLYLSTGNAADELIVIDTDTGIMTETNIGFPFDVAYVDPADGSFYVIASETDEFQLWRVNPDTYATTFVSSAFVGSDKWLNFVQEDFARGNIYVATGGTSSKIITFNIHNGTVLIYYMTNNHYYSMVGFNPNNGHLFFAEDGQSVYEFDPATQMRTLFTTLPDDYVYGSIVTGNFRADYTVNGNILYTVVNSNTTTSSILGYDVTTGETVFTLPLDDGDIYLLNLMVITYCDEWS